MNSFYTTQDWQVCKRKHKHDLKPKIAIPKSNKNIVQEHIFFSFNTPKHIHSPMNKHMIFPAQSLSSLMNAQ